MRIKRKNGVFQGFDFGPKKEMTAEQKKARTASASESFGSRPGALHGVKVTTKPNTRKNGVYQGHSVDWSNTNSRKERAAKAAKAAERKTPTAGERYASDLAKNSQTPSAKAKRNIQEAAKRRGYEKLRNIDRNDRKRAGDFKGKYWGPDKFKGNQTKIDAWKKAGKPRNADGTPKG